MDQPMPRIRGQRPAPSGDSDAALSSLPRRGDDLRGSGQLANAFEMLDSMNNAPVNLSLNPSQQLDSQQTLSVPQRPLAEEDTSTLLDSSSHALWAPFQQVGTGALGSGERGVPTPVAEAGETDASASDRRSSGGAAGGGNGGTGGPTAPCSHVCNLLRVLVEFSLPTDCALIGSLQPCAGPHATYVELQRHCGGGCIAAPGSQESSATLSVQVVATMRMVSAMLHLQR